MNPMFFGRMNKAVVILGLLMASPFSVADDEVDWSLPLPFEGIFVLENTQIDVLQQCARDSIDAKLAWRPTFEQVKIVDNRLRAYLKESKSNFKVLPKDLFHRQYIGYTDEQGEWIYVNIYPAKDQYKKEEARKPIVSCEKSRLYWGISFSIETFEFSDIRFNDKVIIPLDSPVR
jgi:hypothetical protein